MTVKTTVTRRGGFRTRYRVAYVRAIVNMLRNHFHRFTLMEQLDNAWEWQHQGDWQRLCPHPPEGELRGATWVSCGTCGKTLRRDHPLTDLYEALSAPKGEGP